MRVLHITTVRSGSTGRTATDLRDLLINKGIEYKIAFSEADSNPLGGDILIGNRFDHKLHAFLSRLFGLQGYFSYFATRSFLKKVKAYGPDLVQLGNLHANYINLPLLFRFLAKERIPVVMILHDCWFFTGRCTHFTAKNCYKWREQCYRCPALKTGNVSWFFDFSKKMYNDRRCWYESLPSLTVIAVSDWEKNQAEQSPLFTDAEIVRVYNWIDTDVFSPASASEMEAVRRKYNLASDIKFLISVGAGWESDSDKTKDAISLSELLPEEYKLIIVGRGVEGAYPESVIRIPYTSDQRELVALYSLAQAYIHFSVEDTFGKVIAEAMACGTVPIVFNSTACPETAGKYGIVVPPHDVKAIKEAIPLATDPERRKRVRDYAVDNYKCPDKIEKYWGGKEN